MASEFITRVEHGKDEPYTVIFRTDDADKYKHIEDECRRMIGHERPTVDAVPVTRCAQCKWCDYPAPNSTKYGCRLFDRCVKGDWFCADGERKDGERRSDD